jgi:hypothetical protein
MSYDQVLLTAAVAVALALTPSILQAHRPQPFAGMQLHAPAVAIGLDDGAPQEGSAAPTSSGGDAFIAEGYWTGGRD